MSTETDISNMALAHLKIAKRIGNLRSESSNEAIACRTFYDTARDEVLRDFDWPFATKIAPLALVTAQPTPEWGYAYRYPVGCINFRKIQSGCRVLTNDNLLPWRIAADDTGLLIFTDQPNAVGEWTYQVTNTQVWPPDFVMTYSLKLSTYIAPSLTGSDPYKLGDKAEDRYQKELIKASANARNERQMDPEADADAIRARNDGLPWRSDQWNW